MTHCGNIRYRQKQTLTKEKTMANGRINNRVIFVQQETLTFEKIRGEWRASIILDFMDFNRPIGERSEDIECFSWGKTKAQATAFLMKFIVSDTKNLLKGDHLTQKIRAKKEAEKAQMQDFENHVREEV